MLIICFCELCLSASFLAWHTFKQQEEVTEFSDVDTGFNLRYLHQPRPINLAFGSIYLCVTVVGMPTVFLC